MTSLHIRLWDRIPPSWGVLNTTFCDKVCQWLATGRWFSPGTLISSTNKTDCHDITEILLKVVLSIIKPNQTKSYDPVFYPIIMIRSCVVIVKTLNIHGWKMRIFLVILFNWTIQLSQIHNNSVEQLTVM